MSKILLDDYDLQGIGYGLEYVFGYGFGYGTVNEAGCGNGLQSGYGFGYGVVNGTGDGYGHMDLYEYFHNLKIEITYMFPTRILNYYKKTIDFYE